MSCSGVTEIGIISSTSLKNPDRCEGCGESALKLLKHPPRPPPAAILGLRIQPHFLNSKQVNTDLYSDPVPGRTLHQV